jgi:cyclic-di-GMP-binding protein
MALNLNIPALKDNPNIIAETRPQKISQALLDHIAKNPLDIASHLHSELEISNRQKISPSNRAQALDAYRPLLISTVQALSEDYCSAALPLHDKAKLAAAAVESLWLELGYGYKHVLVDLQNQLIKLGTDKSSANAIQRAMHAVAEQALTYYQTYATPPEHIWSDLHQLYYCAVKLGVQNVKIDEKKSIVDSNSAIAYTIENTYKHALLMSLADPQHLTQRNMRLAAEYLALHVENAKISMVAPIEITTSCFIVNLSSSKPPVPYNKQKTAPNPESDILLQTLELVIAIHQDLSSLKNNQLPKDGGVPASANRDEYIDLLTYLIKHWGVTQKRIFNRTKSEGEIEIVTGIPAIHYFSSTNAENANNTKMSASQITNENKPLPSLWNIINISAIGMSVRRHPTADKNIRIGGLLGFKTKNETHWSIGLVRWAACGSKDKLDVGVQLIAPYAQSATAFYDKTGREELVLLLPELAAVKQAATIIARVGTYRPARQLSITYNNNTDVIMLTKIVERSHHFERIQFSVISE